MLSNFRTERTNTLLEIAGKNFGEHILDYQILNVIFIISLKADCECSVFMRWEAKMTYIDRNGKAYFLTVNQRLEKSLSDNEMVIINNESNKTLILNIVATFICEIIMHSENTSNEEILKKITASFTGIDDIQRAQLKIDQTVLLLIRENVLMF